MDTFYVRAGIGNDTNNDGLSPAKAFRTITRAVERLTDGDTIIVGPGIYSERVDVQRGGTAAQPIVLLADPTGSMTGDSPGQVVVDAGGQTEGIRLSSSPFITVDGFTVIGATNAGIQVRSGATAVAVRNCQITDNLGDGILVQGSSDILLFDNLVANNSGRGVAATGSPRLRAVNNTIFRCGDFNLQIGGSDGASPNAFLRNNVILDSRRQNVRVDNGTPSSIDGYDSDANMVFPATYSPADVPHSGDINQDALFIDPLSDNFRLSQTSAGQSADSPAVDAGGTDVAPSGPGVDYDVLRARTTATNGNPDTGPIDLGYHYLEGMNLPRPTPAGATPTLPPVSPTTGVRPTPTGTPIPAITLYVRASGDDANDGSTPDSALKSLSAATKRLGPGSTLVVGPGTYTEQVVAPTGASATLPVTFLADPTGLSTNDVAGPVVIDATGLGSSAFLLDGAPNVVIDGFSITGASGRNMAGIEITNKSDGAIVRNCQVFSNLAGPADGIAVRDSDNVLLFNNLIYDNGRRGVLIGGNGSDNARLINNTIVNNTDRGIAIGTSELASVGAFLRNNIVQDNRAGDILVATGPPSSVDGYDTASNLVFPLSGPAGYSPMDLPHLDDVNEDAAFVDPSTTNYRLAQIAAGEAADSPAIDAGVEENATGGPSADFGTLRSRTTASDGRLDTGPIDLGYHYLPGASSPSRPGRTYFVRLSGNDANDGKSPENALQTIGAAVNLVRPGDQVIVGPGEYRERVDIQSAASGTSSRQVIFRADPTGKLTGDDPGLVIVNAAGANSAIQVTQARSIVIDGFTAVGGTSVGILVRTSSEHAIVRNCQVMNDQEGIFVQASDNVLLFNNLIVQNSRRGIVVSSGAINPRIINNTIVGNGDRGIVVGTGTNASTGGLLQNNIVQDNGNTNVQANTVSLDGLTLSHNLVFPATYSPKDADTFPRPTDIEADALFVNEMAGDYRLVQQTSPAVDGADPDTDPLLRSDLARRTTGPEGLPDIPPPDMGYHYPLPLD